MDLTEFCLGLEKWAAIPSSTDVKDFMVAMELSESQFYLRLSRAKRECASFSYDAVKEQIRKNTSALMQEAGISKDTPVQYDLFEDSHMIGAQ